MSINSENNSYDSIKIPYKSNDYSQIILQNNNDSLEEFNIFDLLNQINKDDTAFNKNNNFIVAASENLNNDEALKTQFVKELNALWGSAESKEEFSMYDIYNFTFDFIDKNNAEFNEVKISKENFEKIISDKDNIDDKLILGIINMARQTGNQATVSFDDEQLAINIEREINSTGKKDGVIQNTKQGARGDCWLVAGANSLNTSEIGKQIIKNALEYKDNNTIVHLATGDVTISDEQLEKAKYSGRYASGDDDMIILELAVEQTITELNNGKKEFPGGHPWWFFSNDTINNSAGRDDKNDQLDGGTSQQLYYLLTGNQRNIVSSALLSSNEKVLSNIENAGENVIASGNFKENCTVQDINGNDINLHKNHAYTIKNATGDSVTIINPWDSSKEIVLPKKTFLGNVSTSTSINLNGESDSFFEKCKYNIKNWAINTVIDIFAH